MEVWGDLKPLVLTDGNQKKEMLVDTYEATTVLGQSGDMFYFISFFLAKMQCTLYRGNQFHTMALKSCSPL